MEQQRPNPDKLLVQVQAEERAARRGRLKVFFGACAGVGKTYTMLEAARRQAADGVDIVIGYVEPHARQETMALLEGLPAIPLRQMFYHGTKLSEFNLDAALARKPAIIIVDELAHTNAPTSRHTKRWQDVMELLDAGIDVYTTLNVQHVETLNDIVAQFSGVRVRETVPDTVFDQADEVELVDLPPDELLERLADGKIYIPERVAAAVENFFQKRNLVVLRELALRRTAEWLNAHAEIYRRKGEVVATAERLLVCVGPSPFSARLIRAAARMALSLRCPWLAISVKKPGSHIDHEAQDRLWANLGMASLLGAETATLSGNDVAQEILAYAKARSVTKIIVGKPLHPRWRDLLHGSLVYDLIRQSGSIDVYAITGEEGDLPRHVPSRKTKKIVWPRYLLSVMVVIVATAIGKLMSGPDLSNIVMIYLVGVVLLALRGWHGPALLTSILSASALNFFFISPLFTFTLDNSLYWITVVALALTGIIISSLVARIRNQADTVRQRELHTTTLYALSRELAGAATIAHVSDLAKHHLCRIFQCDISILMPDSNNRLVAAPATCGSQDIAVAQWVFDHTQPAGLGTDTLPSSPYLFEPLSVSGKCMGVVALSNSARRQLTHEQMQMLSTLTALIAGAMDRVKLADKVRQISVQIEAEKMRNALLSSVSHDLRTPLTGIIGAADTLLESTESLSAPVRNELLQTISSEAERINRLIGNLLDMTRLESGQIIPNREWLPVEEIVGAAVRRCVKRFVNMSIDIHLPEDLPMLHADSVLMEQVLVNLVDNAVKYSPAGGGIEISARADNENIVVTVADRGPGIPQDQRHHIFEKFVRGRETARTPGVGLGLAICRAIVAVHKGRIWVEERPDGGSIFCFSIPREIEPTITEETDQP